ncbi:hypothetical protein PG987_008410 [Apiospora arundinis]
MAEVGIMTLLTTMRSTTRTQDQATTMGRRSQLTLMPAHSLVAKQDTCLLTWECHPISTREKEVSYDSVPTTHSNSGFHNQAYTEDISPDTGPAIGTPGAPGNDYQGFYPNAGFGAPV